MASILESSAAKFFREGQFEDAAQAYTDALAQLSEAATPHKEIELLYNRSSCYLKLKQYALVVEDCSEILQQDNNRKAFGRSVFALRKLGYYNEACETATKWLNLNPDDTQARQQSEQLEALIDALDDPDDDVEADLLEEELAGERIPPEGREDEELLCSPSIAGNTNNSSSNSSSKDNSKLFYCEFCGITFQTKRELALHCRSDLHRKKIVSDEGRNWEYRPPPRGLSGEEYSLCQRFADDGKCRLGERCVEAHSHAELAEWKERFEYRKGKVQKAKEILLVGNTYSDQLLERLMTADNPDTVMVQKLDTVNFVCNDLLKHVTKDKKFSDSWLFTVTSRDSLQRVCLLDDQHRHLFNINSITVGPKKAQKSQKIDDGCQEWTNPSPPDDAGLNALQKVYRIKIAFRTEIYGTFRQTIIFDFGSEPVLFKEVCVDSAPLSSLEELTQQVTSLLDIPRWDTTKIPLVEFSPVCLSGQNKDMQKKEKVLTSTYPVPHAATYKLSEAVVNVNMSKDNYRARMHDLLYIEEMAQYSSIARYNVKTCLQLVQKFLLIPGQTDKVRHADEGELIARMKLNSDLCEDTLHGRLILQNVFTVYLAQYDGKKKVDPDTIYEAYVEDRGKDFLMLRLSARMVSDLGLKPDTETSVQVQFHLNRVPLCQMHLALDRIDDPKVLFPDHTERTPSIPWTPKRQWSHHMDSKLNAKQKEAVVAITTSSNVTLPPILVVGPYGTGKTYTLAQVAKQLLLNESSRILICTHSNSAADLYVRDYFHPVVIAGDSSARPLRIYYRHRRVDTVDHVVVQYCLIVSASASEVYFRTPTREDIEDHRIVIVTLSTSQDLYDLDLPKGYFTHILVDEAAQAMECETIMPLALAGPQTRVVLAGDHMQMSPEVHSEFTRDRHLHVSLLERLHDRYPAESPIKILLCENYRSHKAIIDFTSELFYASQLVTSGRQPRHERFYPLTFFTTRGEDEQHQNSTAYYNNAEVYEVVERVTELRDSWPKSWGPFQGSSIGVVAPYHDQVSRIRAELRKRKMAGVSVERVFNVQGKQFRAIFISTVRTRKTCTSDPSEEDQVDYGFLSNDKLLNTAITRAQSLVAVVGDPVSLCSVGKCRKLWERFIEICSQNDSLYGITWNHLRAQLDGVEIKKTYTLNPLAPEFIPSRLRHPIPGETSTFPMSSAQMTQTFPPWWLRFGHMVPPVFRYPYVYPPLWPPQPLQPVIFPGYYQPMRQPSLLSWPQLVPAPLPGTGPTSPTRTKEVVQPARVPTSSQALQSEATTSKPASVQSSASVHPMLSEQARGSPIYIQAAGQPLRGMIPAQMPAWPQSYVGQPFQTYLPSKSVSPRQAVIPGPLSPSAMAAVKDVSLKQPSSGRSSASLSPKPQSGSQIQLLPNVRHAPPHLLQQSVRTPSASMVSSYQREAHTQGFRQQHQQRSADATVSHSPNLQREFYRYIMQRQGVDAANRFLKTVQREGQMGSSSPSHSQSPVPIPMPPNRDSGRHEQASLGNVMGVGDLRGNSGGFANHHQRVNQNPSTSFASNFHPRQQEVISASANVQSGSGLHTSIDFSAPSEIDRLMKLMEESNQRATNQPNTFDGASLVQPSRVLDQSCKISDSAEQQQRQRTAPPLYMRGNDEPAQRDSNKPMSYAAVLRSKPPPSAPKESTPENPLDLLKNLNIKASPGTQAFYQYFS